MRAHSSWTRRKWRALLPLISRSALLESPWKRTEREAFKSQSKLSERLAAHGRFESFFVKARRSTTYQKQSFPACLRAPTREQSRVLGHEEGETRINPSNPTRKHIRTGGGWLWEQAASTKSTDRELAHEAVQDP